MKKPTLSNYIIAAAILLFLLVISMAAVVSLTKFIFFNEPYLFEALMLLSIDFISILLCVSIINANENSAKISKMVDILEEMNHAIIRLTINNARPKPLNLFDFLNNRNTSSTISNINFTEESEKKSKDISELDTKELEDMLKAAIADEDYDTAAQVRDELQKRK
jgi:hypothetical protein